MKTRVLFVALVLCSVAAVAIQTQRTRKAAAPASLAAYVPQDALLIIESPDFAGLLHRWGNSQESAAWLKSANYSVFENSHLFGRLSGAQADFASVAGVPAGSALLNQVAGRQSVFAWYDVGSLEFLYITRMPASQAGQTQLLQARGNFSRRHAGGVDFYVRTGGKPARTVAFAQAGDLLLLATREDLIANALELISGAKTAAVEQEPWFHDASSALPAGKTAPALHMVLNLDRIVPMASFNSYWVQQNITWMGQFRAAASDLYLEPQRFREERVLLPRSPEADASGSIVLAQMAARVPEGSGVYKALATTDPGDAVRALDEKLLGNYKPEKARDLYADDPDLTTPHSGSASDLEVRIDTLPPAAEGSSNEALTAAIQAAGLDAVLTVSGAEPASGLWVRIHSAVVLHTAAPIAAETLAAALQQSLRGSFTAAGIGIGFRSSLVAGQTIYSLTGPRPLYFASAPGNLVMLSDDQTLLVSLLKQAPNADAKPESATLIAGFDHTSQRAPYARLTGLIDGTDSGRAPTFFSQNLGSLSNSFSTLSKERVFERRVDGNLRQTVTYLWQSP